MWGSQAAASPEANLKQEAQVCHASDSEDYSRERQRVHQKVQNR